MELTEEDLIRFNEYKKGRSKVPDFDILKTVIENKKGIRVDIANALNISTVIFWTWRRDLPFIEQMCKEVYEIYINDSCDIAEKSLDMLCAGVPKLDKNGKIDGWLIPPNVTAIIFKLKTQGKDRGYDERNIIEHQSGGKPVKWIFDIDYRSEDDE